MSPKKTILSWSSGKDSAWSLLELRKDPSIEVAGLLTTVNAAANRVAMHAVRRSVVEAQARAAGLPLDLVEIPSPCSNEAYEAAMGAWVAGAVAAGVERIAFGDLYLTDIRKYREAKLAGTGLAPHFPLWGCETGELAREMIEGGLEATITTIDPRHLDAAFAGRAYDQAFLDDLPASVDPCGENGEFHTCATGGPMFAEPVAVAAGEVVARDGFVFADLIPVS